MIRVGIIVLVMVNAGVTAVGPGPALAREIFVAPAGSDERGNGSKANPYGSLHLAYEVAVAGDTIYVRGGVYKVTSSLHFDGTGGSPSAPVKVFAYRGEAPILDGSLMPAHLGNSPDGAVLRIAAPYIWIKGLSVRRAAAGGIVVTGSNNRLEDVSTSENGHAAKWDGTGLRVQGVAANNLFLRVDSYLNRDQLGSGDNADGFAFHSTGSGNIFRDCRAWLNSDDGFDFFNATNNSRQGAALVEWSKAWGNGYAADGSTPLGDGRGFKMGGQRSASEGNLMGTSGGHTFRFNLAWENRMIGFDANEASIPLRVEYNQSFDNGMFDFYLGKKSSRSIARWNRDGGS